MTLLYYIKLGVLIKASAEGASRTFLPPHLLDRCYALDNCQFLLVGWCGLGFSFSLHAHRVFEAHGFVMLTKGVDCVTFAGKPFTLQLGFSACFACLYILLAHGG